MGEIVAPTELPAVQKHTNKGVAPKPSQLTSDHSPPDVDDLTRRFNTAAKGLFGWQQAICLRKDDPCAGQELAIEPSTNVDRRIVEFVVLETFREIRWVGPASFRDCLVAQPICGLTLFRCRCLRDEGRFEPFNPVRDQTLKAGLAVRIARTHGFSQSLYFPLATMSPDTRMVARGATGSRRVPEPVAKMRAFVPLGTIV